MKVIATSPWLEHQDQLEMLVTKAEAIGMTVKLDEHTVYPDARLYDGKGRMLAVLQYNPEDDTWGSEYHIRFFCQLDEVLASFADGRRGFAIYVSYTGEMPKVSKKTLADIKKLLPGEPDGVAVLPHEFS